jgi:hypothetical protein
VPVRAGLVAHAAEQSRPGREAVLHPRERDVGRECLGLGGQVSVRLLAANQCHPGALQGQAGRLLAGARQGLRQGSR